MLLEGIRKENGIKMKNNMRVLVRVKEIGSRF